MKSKQVSEFKETEIGRIPEEWDVGNFSTDLKIKGRIGWKGYKTSDLRFNGPMVIGGEHIKSTFFLDLSTTKHLSREKFLESPEIILKKNDILVVTRGNGIGKIGFFDGTIKEATINPTLVIISEFTGCSKFLFYYLLSKNGNEKLMSIASGSSIPAIYQGSMKQLQYPKPSKKIQEKITKILYDFDLKIKNLQKQNKILEQIMQALFNSLFVDFNGITGFENSEIGKIPKGWEIRAFVDIIDEIESGKRPKGGINLEDTEIPSIGAENILGLGKYNYSKTKYVSLEFFNQLKTGKIKHNDVLLYKDGASLGRKSIFRNDFPFKQCCINEHVFILRPNKKISSSFLYFWLDQNWMMDNVRNLNSNSAQPGINKSSVLSLPILIPDINTINKFEKVSEPILTKFFKNRIGIEIIIETRNTILPKLMSGEIRV